MGILGSGWTVWRHGVEIEIVWTSVRRDAGNDAGFGATKRKRVRPVRRFMDVVKVGMWATGTA